MGYFNAGPIMDIYDCTCSLYLLTGTCVLGTAISSKFLQQVREVSSFAHPIHLRFGRHVNKGPRGH